MGGSIMSPEQQRTTIAEACGWVMKTEQVEHTNGYQWTEKRKVWVSPTGKRGELPNYLNDLNAMHEAEETLGSYIPKLMRYIYILKDTSPLPCVRATAAQRAEAFLKTIGKWEDDK